MTYFKKRRRSASGTGFSKAAHILYLVILLGIAVYYYFQPQKIVLHGPYKVTRVVDGDTIVLPIDGAETKVRLLGINAPESVHADESKNTEEGRIASAYLKELLDSKEVFIEYDVGTLDQYGRTLAYVYLDDGTTMVNADLIQNGYAKVVRIEPNVKYYEKLKELEEEAKALGLGIWQ